MVVSVCCKIYNFLNIELYPKMQTYLPDFVKSKNANNGKNIEMKERVSVSGSVNKPQVAKQQLFNKRITSTTFHENILSHVKSKNRFNKICRY